MDSKRAKLNKVRQHRTFRVRKRLRGTRERPRLCVVKTNAHIHVQLIDDDQGKTLAATSTIDREIRKSGVTRGNKASGEVLGQQIAEIAKGLGVEKVVFDRGKSKYHGSVASLADAARAGGLQF